MDRILFCILEEYIYRYFESVYIYSTQMREYIERIYRVSILHKYRLYTVYKSFITNIDYTLYLSTSSICSDIYLPPHPFTLL